MPTFMTAPSFAPLRPPCCRSRCAGARPNVGVRGLPSAFEARGQVLQPLRRCRRACPHGGPACGGAASAPVPEPAPIKEAVSAGKESKDEGNYSLPPLFPAEPATNMGNNVGLWIGGAIAFFAAIGGAVYLFMDNSPSPLKNKVGPMEVPAVSAPAPVMNAPTEPVAPALVTDSAPLNTPLAVAPQPADGARCAAAAITRSARASRGQPGRAPGGAAQAGGAPRDPRGPGPGTGPCANTRAGPGGGG